MSSGRKKVVIVAGIRTPFARAWNELAGLSAIDLGKPVVTGLCDSIDPGDIDGLIWGTSFSPLTRPTWPEFYL